MEGIRQWAFSACAALVVCAIAAAVMPKGSMKKVFSITVSVFFLCCLLSPAVARNPGLSIDVSEYSLEDIRRRANLLTEVTSAQSEEALTVEIKKIIAQKLDEMGIKYTDIAINISTNIPDPSYAGASGDSAGQPSFEISGADITLAREYEERHDSIRRELEGSLGFKVRLGYA